LATADQITLKLLFKEREIPEANAVPILPQNGVVIESKYNACDCNENHFSICFLVLSQHTASSPKMTIIKTNIGLWDIVVGTHLNQKNQ